MFSLTLSDVRRWSLLALAVPMLALTACDDDDNPAPANEEESIPEVRVTFTEVGQQNAALELLATVNTAGDLVVQTPVGSLVAGATYNYSVTFGDDELLDEIAEMEADEHRFFLLLRQTEEAFIANAVAVPGLVVQGSTYNRALISTDTDGACAVGLVGTVTIGTVATSTSIPLVATLKHQDDPGAKECSVNANGNPNNGSVDAEVVFQLPLEPAN